MLSTALSASVVTLVFAAWPPSTDIASQSQVPDVGACCTTTGCVLDTEKGCNSRGESFQGPGSACREDFGLFECWSRFEDIRTTGTRLDVDRQGAVIPIGFPFYYFDAYHDRLCVSRNGLLCFGAEFAEGAPQDLPNPVFPNALVAPMWTDLHGGDVYMAIEGPTGFRRLIVQWTDAIQTGSQAPNTFQAVLFETTNVIEFRYEDVASDLRTDAITVGLEDSNGLRGLETSADELRARVCRQFYPNPQEPCLAPGLPGYDVLFPPQVQIGEYFQIEAEAPPNYLIVMFVSEGVGKIPTPYGDLDLAEPLLTVFRFIMPPSGRIALDHRMHCDASVMGRVGYFQFLGFDPNNPRIGGISDRIELTATDGPCDDRP